MPAPPPDQLNSKKHLAAGIMKKAGRGVLLLLLTLVVGFGIYIWAALTFAYSSGERVGYVQKLSKKGWVCKTWEGELALVSQPGLPAQIFQFTASNDEIARQINDAAGKRVRLQYDQHLGVPTTCFGETSYFVTGVLVVGN